MIYIDADAVIANQAFDLRGYLHDKQAFSLVWAHTGQAQWWLVNAGVMMLNFAHPWSGHLVNKLFWLVMLLQPHLRDARTWDDLPDDQSLLHYLLMENEGWARRHIFLEPGSFLNFGSSEPLYPPDVPFVQHVLRHQDSVEHRTETVAKLARHILADLRGR